MRKVLFILVAMLFIGFSQTFAVINADSDGYQLHQSDDVGVALEATEAFIDINIDVGKTNLVAERVIENKNPLFAEASNITKLHLNHEYDIYTENLNKLDKNSMKELIITRPVYFYSRC